jgi:hypothetical protein
MARKKSLRRIQNMTVANQAVDMRFVDIRLLASRSHQAIRGNALPTNSRIHVSIAIGTDDTDKVPHILARPNVVFSAWYEKAKADPALVVDVAFQLRYEFKVAPSRGLKKQVRALVTQMCILHSWPYFREFIQNQISRMGLPPVLLPLMAMPPQAKVKPGPRK